MKTKGKLAIKVDVFLSKKYPNLPHELVFEFPKGMNLEEWLLARRYAIQDVDLAIKEMMKCDGFAEQDLEIFEKLTHVKEEK